MAQTLAQRVSQHDREIAAIRKLVLTGMKMLVQMEKAQKEAGRKFDQRLDRLAGEHEVMRKEMRDLRASQRETDRLLQGLIRSLARGGNGRGPSSH